MNITYNTPPLDKKHFEALKEKIGITIEKNIPDYLKKEFDDLKSEIDIKFPFNVAFYNYPGSGDENEYFNITTLSPINNITLSDELQEFFKNAHLGTHKAYCRELGMIK